MPALVFASRRFNIGSDDLLWPFAGLLLLYLTWSVVFSIVTTVFSQSFFECDRGSAYLAYIVVGLVLSVASVITSISIMTLSTKGTILDDEPRKSVVGWLWGHLVLTILAVAQAIAGVPLFLFQRVPVLVHTMLVVCSVNVAGFILFLIVFWLLMLPSDKSNTVERSFWLKLWGTLLFRKTDEFQALENASVILADLLAFRADLVPSDILAGLILLQQRHHHTNKNILPPDHPPLKSDEYRVLPPITREEVAKAANYVRFAEAVYGWPLYLETNLCNTCKVCPRDCSCLYHDLTRQSVKDETGDLLYETTGDNCCGSNIVSAIAMAKLEQSSVVFASFTNELFTSPFLIALDHSTQSIVISCRGSLSLRDALVDIHLTPEAIPGIKNGWAHSGFLRTARNVKEAIENTGVLQRLMNGGQCEGYQLVFVGHSLGAGTASLLAILFKQTYANVQCYAYSPPGCVLNKEAAKYCESFTTSVIFHNDIVPRLGRVQLERFKDQILSLLQSCHRAKPFLLARGCYPSLPPDYDEESLLDRPVTTSIDEDVSYGTVYVDGGAAEDSLLPQPAQAMNKEQQHAPQMFVPGKILHIVKMEESKTLQRGRLALWTSHMVYEARQGDPNDFHQLWITFDGFITHLPDRVGAVLRHLASSSNQL